MEGCTMDGSPKKKALLELRKQIQALIAHEEAEDPEAAAQGHADAAQAMADSGMGAALNDSDGDEPMQKPSEVHMKFAEYLKPKAKPRRPGTGVVMGAMSAKKEPEKKGPGRPKREVV